MNVRIAAPQKPLRARVTVPSDKSISHRRILFSGILPKISTILLDRCGADVFQSLRAIEQFGCTVTRTAMSPSQQLVTIRGLQDWQSPLSDVDCGNSGTTMRLLMGLVAGQGCEATLVGDASLSLRPMDRVAKPLREMGAAIHSTNGCLPINVQPAQLHGILYTPTIASAQVKSAVLAAGLFATGETIVVETTSTRDHTERLLGLQPYKVGEAIEWQIDKNCEFDIPADTIPGDVSSAAYWIAAALLLDNSELFIDAVGVNPTRTGFIEQIQQQSAAIEITKTNNSGNEPMGTLRCKSAGALSFMIDETTVAAVIDEIPLLAVLAAASGGAFSVRGANELRNKESDRIIATVNGLRAMGVDCELFADGFAFASVKRLRGAVIDCQMDHRIALSFAIAGLCASGETTLLGAECAAISYPTFFSELQALTGAVR
ncbi:MAG: 3-phosphoshikimate 1-carboxyvinyltransferase [bacterium]|nr:3-phosphoshikimate 1-carboxyvinyltransferase [bacterium]